MMWITIGTVHKSYTSSLWLKLTTAIVARCCPQSNVPEEPYLAKNWDDGAIQWWRPHDLSWICLATIPACDRQTQGQTLTNGRTMASIGYRELHSTSYVAVLW